MLIVDTDIQDDVDDVGALAVACALEKEGVTLVGVAVSTPSVWGARAATAVLRHYANLAPVALERGPDVFGPEEFARGISRTFGTDRVDDFAPPVPLLRRVIAESSEPVTIAAIGFHPNLVALMDSRPDEHSSLAGIDLIRERDVRLVVMGGCFDERGPRAEYNFARSPELTARLFTSWPGRIDVVPWEVGDGVITGENLIDHHGYASPVTIAYLLHSGHRSGRPSWDPITILVASERSAPGLSWSERGTVSIGALGESHFAPVASGTHRVASLDDDGAALARELNRLLYASATGGPQ
ncbi:hypothetical protein ASD65_11195 [Microbacterium sp. Root61]|nr:hypothetical protein ASD65_11195 [Microbacterium sp. Root61]